MLGAAGEPSRQRALARSPFAREPQHARPKGDDGAVPSRRRARRRRGQRVAHDTAAADVEVVDEHEPARRRQLRRPVERDRVPQLDHAIGDLVAHHGGAAGHRLERRRVEHPFDVLEVRGHARGAQLEGVVPSELQWPRAEPEDAGANPRRRDRLRLVRQRRQLAARDVDLLRERESCRLAGTGHRRRHAVERLERLHPRALAGRVEHDLVAHAQPAAVDRAGHDATVVTVVRELEHGLHRHPEGTLYTFALTAEGVECLEHRRAGVPRHRGRAHGEIVAVSADHGNDRRRRHVDRGQEGAELARELVECLLAASNEVHLVDDDRDLPHAEHREQIGVPTRVLLDPFARVEHQERRFGARRSRDHVLEELDVSRRVQNEVPPLGRAEEHARRVDRDSLRALVLQRVEQKRILERLRRAGAEILDLFEAALRQRARIGEQPADDRALAVVDVPHDDDPHSRLDLGRIGDGAERVGCRFVVERQPFLVESARPGRGHGSRKDAHARDSPRCAIAGSSRPFRTRRDSSRTSGASVCVIEQ